MKKILLNVLCIALAVASLIVFFMYRSTDKDSGASEFNDGIEQVDLNTITLEDSGVQVSFSDVILSKIHEERKLMVYSRKATVSTEITSANGQEADQIALNMVREVYEPVIQAIDGRYSVNVEFK